jgi:hypothetical protein
VSCRGKGSARDQFLRRASKCGAAAPVITQVKIGLDELEFDQLGRAGKAPDEIDAGVEEVLLNRAEDALGCL